MKSTIRAQRSAFTAGKRRAFTLIELLTVIAIIAVLAAIIFPVFGAVQENARRNSCMSNMQTISSALKQYELDNRKYPDFLFAPAIKSNGAGGCEMLGGKLVITSGAGEAACTPEQASATGKLGGDFADAAGNVVASGGLYPEYIKSYSKYTCTNNTWFHPTGDKAFDQETPGTVGYPVTAPASFLNATTINKGDIATLTDKYGDAGGAPALRFYKFDSYSVNPWIVKDAAGNALPKIDLARWPVRYRRQWIPAVQDPTTITNDTDKKWYQNQLMWRDPSDDAAVTMCSQHATKGKAIVLYLSGTAKVKDLRELQKANSADPTTDFDTYKMMP